MGVGLVSGCGVPFGVVLNGFGCGIGFTGLLIIVSFVR